MVPTSEVSTSLSLSSDLLPTFSDESDSKCNKLMDLTTNTKHNQPDTKHNQPDTTIVPLPTELNEIQSDSIPDEELPNIYTPNQINSSENPMNVGNIEMDVKFDPNYLQDTVKSFMISSEYPIRSGSLK